MYISSYCHSNVVDGQVGPSGTQVSLMNAMDIVKNSVKIVKT